MCFDTNLYISQNVSGIVTDDELQAHSQVTAGLGLFSEFSTFTIDVCEDYDSQFYRPIGIAFLAGPY